jgi:hypothetical protein
MAGVDEFSPKQRKRVSEQTASFLAAAVAGENIRAKKGAKSAPKAAAVAVKKAKPPKLAESFVYITLPLAAVVDPPEDLSALLAPSGSWLHLIRTGADATHFAISDTRGFDDSHTVLALTEGDLPQKIYAAVKWLDAKDGDGHAQDTVRVLAFPALFVYALCILRKKGPTAIVVSTQPKLGDSSDKDLEEIPLVNLLQELKPAAQAALAQAKAPGNYRK